VTTGTGDGAYAMPAGTHTVTVLADDVNRIQESIETNNTFTQTVVVGGGGGGGGGAFDPGGACMNSDGPERSSGPPMHAFHCDKIDNAEFYNCGVTTNYHNLPADWADPTKNPVDHEAWTTSAAPSRSCKHTPSFWKLRKIL